MKKIPIALLFAFIFIGSETTIKPLIEVRNDNSSSVSIPEEIYDSVITDGTIIEKPDLSSNIESSIHLLPSLNQNSSNTNNTSEEFTKKVKVYINPSVQKSNMYACSLGSEAKNMQDIANLMKGYLSTYKYIDLLVNDGTKSLSSSCIDSNKFNSDIHLALHSNAGGGRGSEIYYYKDKSFSKYIYNNYVTLNSFPQRGIKYGGSLYELKTVKAKYTSLIELQFHDNEEEAQWIVNNKRLIAENLSESINECSKKLLNL